MSENKKIKCVSCASNSAYIKPPGVNVMGQPVTFVCCDKCGMILSYRGEGMRDTKKRYYEILKRINNA